MSIPMIEKAARDLCVMSDADPDDWIDVEDIKRIVPDSFMEFIPSKASKVRFWVTAVPFVVSVLRSVKEPTPAMFAAVDAPLDGNTQMIAQVYEDWQAMIDAALEVA